MWLSTELGIRSLNPVWQDSQRQKRCGKHQEGTNKHRGRHAADKGRIRDVEDDLFGRFRHRGVTNYDVRALYAAGNNFKRLIGQLGNRLFYGLDILYVDVIHDRTQDGDP